MKQYEEVFFSVVRAALWKTHVEVPEGFADWSKVLKLAKAQTLTGLVADVLLGNAEIRAQLPEQAVAKLQGAVRNNMLMHNMLNNTLILVVSKLRENGVESVLLKGQGIARNYPVPELRQCGDIDLYVSDLDRTFHLIYSGATQYDNFRLKACKLAVKFREPNPANR
jgi:hypothetical protein